MRRFGTLACIAAAGVAASAAAWHATRPVDILPALAIVARAAPHPAARPPLPPLARRAESTVAGTPNSFDTLEQSLDTTDPALRDRVLAERLPGLTQRDPERAARFAELLTDERLRELALLQVAMTWARSDVTAAVHWAESLADPMRDAAITDISLALAETSPARAVALRERFASNDSPVPDNTLVNLAHQWAEQDFDAALAWANAQPPGAQRDQVLERLVFVRAADGEFAEAAELARSLIAAPGIRAEALAAVAQQES